MRAWWTAPRDPRPPPLPPALQGAWRRVLAEVTLRLLLLALFIFMNTFLEPVRRDVSAELRAGAYSQPFCDSYVPSTTMLVVILLLPLGVFAAPCALGAACDATHAVLAWTLAMAVNAVVTEAIKLSVGRPRPDFFYRCFPDGRLVEHVAYTGPHRVVMEGRKSFPSGHSSFSFCSLGFVSLYMCGRLRPRRRGGGGGAGRLACCVPPLALAGAIGASRCLDHHHHWDDVAAGAALGLALAYCCYRRYYPPLDSDMSGVPYEP